jgi:hypothetical protein
MHKILTENPRYKANVEGMARVTEMQGHLARRTARIQRERQEARQKYEQEYRLAVMRGEEPTAPPPEPPPEPALAMELAGTMDRLVEEQFGIKRDLAAEVDRKAAEREREILEEVVTTPGGELGPLVAEVNSLAFTVHACMGVGRPVSDQDPRLDEQGRHRCVEERERFTAGEVLDAALQGRSLLHVQGERRLSVVHEDRGRTDDQVAEGDGPGYAEPRLERWMRQDRARQRGMRVVVPADEVRNLVRGI